MMVNFRKNSFPSDRRAGGAKLLEEFGSQRGVGLEIFENTYKLEPDPGTKFSVRRTEELVHNIMNTELANYKYSDETAGEKITCLTKNIMEELKTLGFVRYKMVVHAIVTRQGMRRPGLSHASRGIWNTAFDNWAAVTFDSPRVAAVVTVYGVYFE